MNKICHKCRTYKSIIEFRFKNKANNEYTDWCRICFSIYERDRYKKDPTSRRNNNKNSNIHSKFRNQELIWQILSNTKCNICHSCDFRVLEFDHIDPSNKKTEVSSLINSSVDTLKTEINKCNILCRNCHRIKTHKELNDWRNQRYEIMINNQICDISNIKEIIDIQNNACCE